MNKEEGDVTMPNKAGTCTISGVEPATYKAIKVRCAMLEITISEWVRRANIMEALRANELPSTKA